MPDARNPDSPPEAISHPRVFPRRATGQAVLLVEDEASLRTVMRLTLTQSGYTVLDAGDGKEALQLADRHRDEIALLLTDVVMPEMNGAELATAITRFIPSLPILYMSGYQKSVLQKLGVDSATSQFLAKPFLGSDLIVKVKSMLAAATIAPTGANPPNCLRARASDADSAEE